MLALNNKIISYVDKKEKRSTVIKRKKKLVKLVKEINAITDIKKLVI